MTTNRRTRPRGGSLHPGHEKGEPDWYRDAVFYELRVGAFQDSDGDGIGDFRGLAERLDYLADLGVTTLWLLPFCPSPLRDDGYDIADYTDVHPNNGTLDDFRHFLREAHRRHLRVVTELVINHTSDQHPWFQRARRSPAGSKWRDFYVWSDTPERYSEARVIFQDFEPSNWSWDPVAKAYYWHRFYAHQPDLNFESPHVRKAVFRFLDFWFRLGVDGLRLDAIPYLFEREGTNCENLPETHAFLKELRAHVDANFADRMLLAEANQWPEDAVAYFGKSDECHMSFHFPLMPRLFMALHMEDRHPIIDILDQTPAIPDGCQWALFLRNHDELTLEMVTDEERDYMYRVYAHETRARINLGIRRRLGPLLGNDRRRIELMNALLFSLPGTPVLYYGDEIGMGDNFYLGDRNGVRTPMQWSSDRNAGFSRANPQQLHLPVIIDPEYHYEAINVEAQQRNPHSLLNWTKRLVALRKRHRAFGRGSIEFLHPANRKVLAFFREHEGERILVVVNLSRYAEYVELDLSRHEGQSPVELFSGRAFPRIGRLPYLLTLGPHSFLWFRVDHAAPVEVAAPAAGAPPALRVDESWERIVEDDGWDALASALPGILRTRRWFGSKARAISAVSLRDAVRLPLADGSDAIVLVIDVAYSEGDPESYALPLRFETGASAETIRHERPGAVLAELTVDGRDGGEAGVLVDALEVPEVGAALLRLIGRRRRARGESGELVGVPTSAFRRLHDATLDDVTPRLLRAEQSNSSVLFGDRLVLKVFRRLAPGVNPDLELGRFLTERARFPQIPAVAGAIEYRSGRDRDPTTLGILQAFVPNEGDAWSFTLDQLDDFFERVRLAGRDRPTPAGPPPDRSPQQIEASTEADEWIGGFLEMARLLGQRTAELHRALAVDADDPAFAPEPFTRLYQRAQYQSMRTTAQRSLDLLRNRLETLPEPLRASARRLLEAGEAVDPQLRWIVGDLLDGRRIRCHGDYHLGQLLHTGHDFVIIDFEGEPARPLGERRLKRSPLRDVAGMLRSFDYATHAALRRAGERGWLTEGWAEQLERWGRFWQAWVGAIFLGAYLRHMDGSGLLPSDPADLQALLRTFLVDKSFYELAYELNNRPDWVRIPLAGLIELLGLEPGASGTGSEGNETE